MGYSINVARNNVHLFRTDESSLVSENVAKDIFRLMCKKFPPSEGYKVTCTKWTKTGKDVFA